MSISGINSALNSYSSGSSFQLKKSLLDSRVNSSSSSCNSYLSNSSPSRSLYDVLDITNAAQRAADNTYNLLASTMRSKIQITADMASKSIKSKLTEAFAAAGIDTSNEIDLKLGSNAKVSVSNDNANAKKIENTINNNASLKKSVVQYLKLAQAIAPTLNRIDSSAGSSLYGMLSSLSHSSGGTGTAKLILKGDSLEAVYKTSGGSSVISSV